MDSWSALTAAIALGLAGIIAVLFSGLKEIINEWARNIVSQMKRKTYLTRIERLASFLHVLESIRDLPEVQRCILFTGHNCGGLPTAGKEYSVRALEGWTTKEGKESPEEKFNFALKVDAHYTKALKDMMEQGHINQLVADMDINAKLRAYYESEGVKFTRMYFLGIAEQDLIFLSVGSYDQDHFSRPTDIDLQLKIDRMRNLITDTSSP